MSCENISDPLSFLAETASNVDRLSHKENSSNILPRSNSNHCLTWDVVQDSTSKKSFDRFPSETQDLSVLNLKVDVPSKKKYKKSKPIVPSESKSKKHSYAGVNDNKDKSHRMKKKLETLHLQKKLDAFQMSFFALLPCLVPKVSCYPLPTLASIQPIIESCVVRINVCSHNSDLVNGRKVYHEFLNFDVTIKPGHCLLFIHDGTVHGGGPSSTPCTRYFTIYGSKEKRVVVSNGNNVKEVIKCTGFCSICQNGESYLKRSDGGTLFHGMINEDLDKFNIEDHGFCVLQLKTKKIVKNRIVNNVRFIEQGFTKMKFHSIGQEEIQNKNGKRNVLSKNGRNVICEDQILSKAIKGDLSHYMNECHDYVVNWLTLRYSNDYERKGSTILTNSGEVKYQKLHLDALPTKKEK